MAAIFYQTTHCADLPCRSRIEWLGEDDCAKLNEQLALAGQKPLKEKLFREMYRKDLARYCLLYHEGVPVTRGAVEPYSPQAWEAGDIRTVPDWRGKGFAKEMLQFLTQYIISHGKTATCHTEDDNLAMQAVIEFTGYQELKQ